MGSKLGSLVLITTLSFSLNACRQSELGGSTTVAANSLATAPSASTLDPWLASLTLGSAQDDVAKDVKVDAAGNVYVTGYTAGDLAGEAPKGGADAFLIKFAPTGERLWTRLLGSAADDKAYSMDLDASGLPVIGGFTSGSLPGQASSGGSDLFIAKFDGSGNLIWVRQRGTPEEDVGHALAISPSGSILLTGYSKGALDGQANSCLCSGSYAQDVILVEWDSTGNWQQTFQYGSGASDEGWAIAVSASGEVMISGNTWERLAPFETYDWISNMNQSKDIFTSRIAKNSLGKWARVWDKQISSVNRPGLSPAGNAYDEVFGMTWDAQAKNAYLTGQLHGAILNPNGVYEAHDGSGPGFFVSRIDTQTSERLWINKLSTPQADYGMDILVDSLGDIVTLGYSDGDIDGHVHGNPGKNETFLAKWNANGSKRWSHLMNFGRANKPYAITEGRNGTAYIVGKIKNAAGDWDILVIGLSDPDQQEASPNPPVNPPQNPCDPANAQFDWSCGGSIVGV